MNHILIVDDEADIRASLEAILREEDYVITTAGTAKEFANRRIGDDPSCSHHIYIVPPTRLPCNRVVGIQR